MSRHGGTVYEEHDTIIRDHGPRDRRPPPRPRSTVFEERDTFIREEAPRRPPVQVRERDREYEEVDTFIRRETREPDRRPAFLRDDYGPPETGGPLVLREREVDTFTRPVERRRSPSHERYRERIIETTRERTPSPPPVERVRTRIVERERERSISPPRGQLRARIIETTDRIPIRERSPSPIRYRERIIERERERSPSPARSERIHITETRESRAPTIVSRVSSRSPSPPPIIRAPPIHQEVITHHRHIDHGMQFSPQTEFHSQDKGYEVRNQYREPVRAPSPPPPPRRMSPRIKETDIDIHTSRNNTEIDIHTKNRSRTPQPSSHNSSGSLSRRDNFYEEDIVYEQERDKLRVRDNQLSITRRRSVSARPPPQRFSGDLRETESEADFYARKVEERAYIGEAYNGATKDWAIVDVPPGTEKVRMDGVGGGAEEITWQRYNGVRRSKFIPSREPEPERERERIEIREERRIEDPSPRSSNLDIQIHSSSSRREGGAVFEREREYERIEESSDRRVGPPRGPKNRTGDLWTEITKDLVVADAITQLGYDFEETEFFFYVLQYLRYVRSSPFPLPP
jgi:hypothetical protein